MPRHFPSLVLRTLLALALAGTNLFIGGASVRAEPAAPATGGTFSVNSAADSVSPGTKLTLREALLIARGGTGAAKGLGRALTPSEEGRLSGCTITSHFITGGCGMGFPDTIQFDPSLLAATFTPGSPLPPIDDSAPTIIDGSGVFPTIDASLIGAAHHGLYIASDGNTVENLEVLSAPADDFHVSGNNNLLHNVWALLATRYGVYLSASNNVVDASLVGVNNGQSCFGNSAAGIYIEAAATGNTVQNSDISCNAGSGVVVGNLGGNGSNTIGPNNLIGTDPSGAVNVGNSGDGLLIDSDSNAIFSNTVAFNHSNGIDIGRGFNGLTGNTVISNTRSGLLFHGAAHNNYIGCNPPLCGPIAGNRLSANLRYGIELTGTAVAVNYVAGNQIGVAAGGYYPQGNVMGGILVDGGHDNLIGIAGAGLNNISGNIGNGVTLDHGANNMTLSNNCIGEFCQPHGSGMLPNGGRGVVMQGGAHDNMLGVSGSGLGNDITWSGAEGVLIGGATTAHNTLTNNYISSNHIAGVLVGAGAHDNLIGGGDVNNRNSISDNQGDGVVLNGGAYSNTLGYNAIGTDSVGNNSPNMGYGVSLDNGAHGNFVGLADSQDHSNKIYYNISGGVLVDGSTTTGNTFVNNDIMFNAGEGMHISGGAHNNVVGGTGQNDFNNIHGNTGSGIALSLGAHNNLIDLLNISLNGRHGIILTGTGTMNNVISMTVINDNFLDGINEGAAANDNLWTGVNIYNNGGLGIDKYALDDANNTVSGPFPIITSVVAAGGVVTVSGTSSGMGPIFDKVTVELYLVAPDPSGYGEGKAFIGSVPGAGNWSITYTAASAGCYTAIQTQVESSLSISRSSEFGPNSCGLFLFLPNVRR